MNVENTKEPALSSGHDGDVATSANTPKPRERLKFLCLEYTINKNEEEIQQWLDEILQLAQSTPEVFFKDIVVDKYAKSYWGPTKNRTSPLGFIIIGYSNAVRESMRVLTIGEFETILSASADGILEVADSWGETIMHKMVHIFCSSKHKTDMTLSGKCLDLMKFMITKSKTQLTIPDICGRLPLLEMARNAQGEKSQKTIRYMIDHHPGNPFEEKDEDNKTLLAAVVGNARTFSFDFIKYVLEQHPEAARVRETDKYQSSVFHAACSSGDKDVLRLLLNVYPKGAFNFAKDGETPLFNLLKWNRGLHDDQHNKLVEMMSLANPKAIFCNRYFYNSRISRSPFSYVSIDLLDLIKKKRKRSNKMEKESGEDKETASKLWSRVYFLTSVYRYGNKTRVEEAWNAPPYPVHMVASCPCPSKFLIHMAESNTEELLKYDNEGRSILALALEAGHSVGPYDHCYHNKRKGVIKDLVQIDERMIGLPDGKTGLYPFMTAACSEDKIAEMGLLDDYCLHKWSLDPPASETSKWNRERIQKIKRATPLICLNTIYFLLRADPSKVLLGLHQVENTDKMHPS